MQTELKSMYEAEKAETDMYPSVAKNTCQTAVRTAETAEMAAALFLKLMRVSIHLRILDMSVNIVLSMASRAVKEIAVAKTDRILLSRFQKVLS